VILDRHFFLSVIGRRGGAAMLLSKAVMLLVIFFAAGRIASAQITSNIEVRSRTSKISPLPEWKCA